MSMTVHNGYILPKMSLSKLHKLTMDFRKLAKEVSVEIIEKLLAETCIDMIDFTSLLGKDYCLKRYNKSEDNHIYSDNTIISNAYFYIREKGREIEKTQIRNPKYDFECKIVFFLMKDKILCLFNAENELYFKSWEKVEGVKEYAYWDNTDKQEDISEEEWEVRKKDWHEIVKNYYPALNGFTANCIFQQPFYDDIDMKRVIANIPTVEKRSKGISKGVILQKKFLELSIKEGNDFSTLMKALDYTQTEEGKKEIEEMANKISTRLIENVTKEILLTNLENLKTFYEDEWSKELLGLFTV